VSPFGESDGLFFYRLSGKMRKKEKIKKKLRKDEEIRAEVNLRFRRLLVPCAIQHGIETLNVLSMHDKDAYRQMHMLLRVK